MKRSTPWIEPGLYVECPYCDNSELLESDASVSLPDEDLECHCGRCSADFIAEGQKSRQRRERSGR